MKQILVHMILFYIYFRWNVDGLTWWSDHQQWTWVYMAGETFSCLAARSVWGRDEKGSCVRG
jgi:hypothetical protein